MIYVGFGLVLLGSVIMVFAAFGVVVLPDPLARQHAATKSGSLALALILLGMIAIRPEWEWFWRLALILVFSLLTLPVASHMLARAAVQESGLGKLAEEAPKVYAEVDTHPTEPGIDRSQDLDLLR
jgi:multicomponent Na+:H+ antiporter subunit G